MNGRLNNVDVLRGLAAIAVMGFHLRHSQPTAMPLFAEAGYIGVDLFFVISGLVIPYSIWSLEKRYGEYWRQEFWRRRLLRIYPLYALTCLVFIFFSDQRFLSHEPAYIAFQLISHALLVQNIFAATAEGLHHVTWTIGLEAQFYIFIALLWPYLRKLPPPIVLVMGVLISIAWSESASSIFPQDFNFQNQLPARLHEFALGYVLFSLAVDAPLSLLRLRPLWLGGAILGGALYASWGAYLADAHSAGAVLSASWRAAFGADALRLMFGFGAGLMLFGAIAAPETRVSRLIGFLGTISYGIYLWHPLMIAGFKLNGWSGTPLIAGVIVSTLVVSSISYYFFESLFLQIAHGTHPSSRNSERDSNSVHALGALERPSSAVASQHLD